MIINPIIKANFYFELFKLWAKRYIEVTVSQIRCPVLHFGSYVCLKIECGSLCLNSLFFFFGARFLRDFNMQVDIADNQERTWHSAFPRLLSSSIYCHLLELCFSEQSEGKSARSDRVPCKYAAGNEPLWVIVFLMVIGTPDSRAGHGSLFSVLLVFVLSESASREVYWPLSNMRVLSCFSLVWLCAAYRLQPTRLLCPWDSPGKSPGVGCHFLL